MTSIRAALADASRALAETSPSPRVDADCLLQHILQKDRAWLRAYENTELDAPALVRFDASVQRRRQGEPVAYITGARGFWSLDLQVGPGVLIPRPETELLVEWALELLPEAADRRVLDLGTGSGAIALAVKQERPHCQVTAVDASAAALAIAADNARRLGLEVAFHESDWFTALGGRRFELILANPPYIAEDDPHLAQGDLRFEPRGALAAPEQGLQALRRIVAATPDHIEQGGWLLLEHGYGQGADVRRLLAQRGFTDIATRYDLGGHERITGGCWAC